MKQFYLTLAFLLPFIGHTAQPPSGLTVFGDCYVSDKASIGFFGDELTLQGNVVGEGDLIMAGKDPQTITAHQQAIERLVVTNPTVVKVKGSLAIRQSLALERGTLDVLPSSELCVGPVAMVWVAPMARLMTNGLVWQTGFSKSHQPIPESNAVDALLSAGLMANNYEFLPPTILPLNSPTPYQNPYGNVVTTPPWAV